MHGFVNRVRDWAGRNEAPEPKLAVTPAHERLEEPSPPGFGRNRRDKNMARYRLDRKARRKRTQAARRRNWGQKRSQ